MFVLKISKIKVQSVDYRLCNYYISIACWHSSSTCPCYTSNSCQSYFTILHTNHGSNAQMCYSLCIKSKLQDFFFTWVGHFLKNHVIPSSIWFLRKKINMLLNLLSITSSDSNVLINKSLVKSQDDNFNNTLSLKLLILHFAPLMFNFNQWQLNSTSPFFLYHVLLT